MYQVRKVTPVPNGPTYHNDIITLNTKRLDNLAHRSWSFSCLDTNNAAIWSKFSLRYSNFPLSPGIFTVILPTDLNTFLYLPPPHHIM